MSKFFELFAKNARSIIAIEIVTFSFAFLFFLAIRNREIPKENAAILNVATGLVLAVLATVCAYYFGSSKDKSDTEKAKVELDKKSAGVI